MSKIKKVLLMAILMFIGTISVKAATIDNGTYYIESALNERYLLDVSGGRTKNNTNVQLWISESTNYNQQWKVLKLSNGYYRITTVLANNMNLDVNGSYKTNGTNVQLYQNNNYKAQQWLIKDAGGGYFYIISRCNNLYVDVRGGSVYNGNNIQMYKGNKSKAQKFKFIPVLKKERTIEDGNYIIKSKLNQANVVDSANSNITNNTNIRSYKSTDDWSQIWTVKYLNNGYYSINSALSDSSMLDVDGAGKKSGTNVQLYQKNNNYAQHWIIKSNGDGTYMIVSRMSHDNLYLDVAGANKSSGTNIQVYSPTNSPAQRFIFTKTSVVPVKSGLYTITNTKLNKRLTINDNLISNRSNVIYSDANDSNSQKWYFKYVGGNYYSILSGFNQLFSLDVTGKETKPGTNLQLYTNKSFPSQLWKIRYEYGKYIMCDKNNSMTIDVGDDIDETNTNTVVNSLTRETSQQHSLEPTKLNNDLPKYNDANIEPGYYYINSALNSNLSIDLSGGSKLNKTNIQVYSTGLTLNQLWYIKKISDGSYSITSSLSPKTSLDITGGYTNSGTNIQLYKYKSLKSQQWYIKDVGGGAYTFVSKLGSLAIDVASSKPGNGTNIYSNKLNYGKSQQFTLKKYTNKKIYRGIDVSSWQYNVDWKKVAQSNIGFVIIRAGFGGDLAKYDDAKFLEYVKGCETYNIPYAIYLYSYADQYKYATDESNHTLRLLKAIKNKGYSPVLSTKVFYDMEDDSMVNTGKKTLTKIADKYCSTMESNGYECGIYANAKWLNNYLDTKELAKKYNIWLAQWPKNNTITNHNTAMQMTPSYNLTGYKYWQFSSNGTINGINTRVDFDLGYDIFD